MLGFFPEKTYWFPVLAIVGVLLAPSAALADPVLVLPAIDGAVRDGLEGPKDGTADMVVERSIVQALNVPQFEDRGIVEFPIDTLPQVAGRATLTLSVFAANGPFPFDVLAFGYQGDGVLSLEDFNAGVVFASVLYTGASSVSFDVTEVLNGFLLAGGSHAGFNLRFSPPSDIALNGPFVAFNSLEYGPAATLAVSAVPEPGTLLLLGAGVACGFRVRQNYRRRSPHRPSSSIA